MFLALWFESPVIFTCVLFLAHRSFVTSFTFARNPCTHPLIMPVTPPTWLLSLFIQRSRWLRRYNYSNNKHHCWRHSRFSPEQGHALCVDAKSHSGRRKPIISLLLRPPQQFSHHKASCAAGGNNTCAGATISGRAAVRNVER